MTLLESHLFRIVTRSSKDIDTKETLSPPSPRNSYTDPHLLVRTSKKNTTTFEKNTTISCRTGLKWVKRYMVKIK